MPAPPVGRKLASLQESIKKAKQNVIKARLKKARTVVKPSSPAANIIKRNSLVPASNVKTSMAKPKAKPKTVAKPSGGLKVNKPKTTQRTKVVTKPSGGLKVKPKTKQPTKPKTKTVTEKIYRPTEETSAGNSQSSSNYNIANTRTVKVKKKV